MDIGQLVTQIRYTDRGNLAEACAIKILRMYCPWASTDEIISWRRELNVIARSQLEDEPARCTITVKFWLNGDKGREVSVSVALIAVDSRWVLEGDGHWVLGWGQPFIKLWYQHGEFVEHQRLPHADFPFRR